MRRILRHATLTIGVAASTVCASVQALPAWADVLKQPPTWYASPAAIGVADAVLAFQRDSGGWPKDVDMTRPPSGPPPSRPDATIDNGATTTQIRLLARVAAANPERRAVYQAAALKGLDYLLAAQYANGGWPQFHPLRKDYSRYITFNDDAMVNAMTVLDDASAGAGPFVFVDDARRTRARDAVTRGVAVILKTQIVIEGALTAWCAQHDEVTLEPRPARSFEHASLSGAESVGIVRFLMTRPRTPETVRAVDAAVAWLTRVRLPDGRWARFYEFKTNRPIYSGRDGIVRYRLDEIEEERRTGYAWLGTWAAALIGREYPRWASR